MTLNRYIGDRRFYRTALSIALPIMIQNGISNFVGMMNDRAEELGCEITHFDDPNGLSNNNQTTAYEMFLITK